MTYGEILDHIYGLGRFGMKPGLERITLLLDRLGNPQRKMAVIHVAGTNGKGSTATFLSAILNAEGYRTGLFTSPHLTRFTERIRICGAEIAEDEVASLAPEIFSAAPESTTFFEVVTAMAFLHFARNSVDIAVMEVGMGGRYDATNAADGILSVITTLGFDHCKYLGNTIEEIAREKGGVIRRGAPVVLSCQPEGGAEVVEALCREYGSPLYRFGRDFTGEWESGSFSYRGLENRIDGVVPGIRGNFQKYNASCAVAAVEALQRGGFTVAASSIAAGIENASWPGRMEFIPGNPPMLLDGAHNPAGAAALARELSEMEVKRVVLVAGIMEDKDLEGILLPLLEHAAEVICVAPPLPAALQSHALHSFCIARGVPARDAGSVSRGTEIARSVAGKDDLVVVTGSLFTVGEARSLLLGNRFEPFRG